MLALELTALDLLATPSSLAVLRFTTVEVACATNQQTNKQTNKQMIVIVGQQRKAPTSVRPRISPWCATRESQE